MPDFEGLFRRHYERTVLQLARMGFSREEARDLAQDTFVRVYQDVANFRGQTIAEENAFIRKTALRVGLNELRRRRAAKRKPEEIPMEDLPSPENAPSRDLFTGQTPLSGEDYAGRRETIQRLLDAIRELPENFQGPLRLRIRGHTYNEIGARLNLTVDTVKSSLRDARRRLHEKLGEEPAGIDLPGDLAEDGRDREI